MAATNTTVPVLHTWTLLTAANVTNVVLENTGSKKVLIKGTSGATPPTDDDGARVMAPGAYRETTVAAMFPGVGSANRIYGRVMSGTGAMMVGHA